MNRFDRRRDRLYERLDPSIGCVIAYGRNRLYLSDTVRPGLLWIRADERTMLSTRAHDMAESEADVDEFVAVESTGEALDRIESRLNGDGPLALEEQTIPASLHRRICDHLGVTETVDLSGKIRQVRVRKDETELQYLQEAARQSDRAHETAREVLEPGMEELALAARVEGAAREAGHEGIMAHGRFDAHLPYGLITSGDNCSKMGSYAYVSHGTGPSRAFPVSAGHRTIQPNDPVLVDIGGVHRGYNADVSRTYVARDSPSERLTRAYEALESIYDDIEQSLRAGNTAESVYEAGLESAKSTEFHEYFQGYGDKKGRFVGHGIGLEIDEPPVLAPGNDRTIPENAVVTIEIFIVFPNNGGVKIEESCRVRDGEPPELLSSVPRRMFRVDS